MPRRKRQISAGIPVHVIQRGNNRQLCFDENKDRRSFLAALGEISAEYHVAVHAYVLMSNHLHLLVTADEDCGVSRMMQQLGRKYVYYYNHAHGRTGTLWEGRFRSSVIATTRYLLACHRYIEMNPVRAGLVSHPRDFVWSSYRTNALGRSSSLISQHRIVTTLGDSVEERCKAYQRLFIGTHEDSDQVIRFAGQTGMTL